MSDALQKALPYPEDLEETYESVIEDTAPQPLEFGLKACKSRDEILTALGNWYRATEAKLAGFDAQWKGIIEAYEADRKRLTNKLEFIEKCIPMYLKNGEEFVNDQVDIRLKPSVSVEIVKEEDIPLEYCVVKTQPDKVKIREALEAETKIEGARLNTKWNLRVKEGGIRAIENAKKRLKKVEA